MEKCMICKEELLEELDDAGFETPSYIFHLCIDCAVKTEDQIRELLFNFKNKEKLK